MPDKIVLAVKSQPPVSGSRGNNDSTRLALSVVGRDSQMSVLRTASYSADSHRVYLGSERQRLLDHAVGKLHAGYFVEARIIFYFRRICHLPAEGGPFKNQHGFSRPARVNCGGKSGRTCADHDHIVHFMIIPFQQL